MDIRPHAKVLVVEDNVICQKVMTRMVSKLGFDCVIIDNGRGAVEAFPQQLPLVVLMDLGLPVMDGHVATQRIRQWESEHHCPKPVVIVALTSQAEEEQRCLSSGFDGFLCKPCQPGKLHAVLDTLGALPPL